MTTNTINDGLNTEIMQKHETYIWNYLTFSLGTYVPSHPQKGLFLHLYVLKFSMIASPGVLTIYTNHPGGNLVHKHKTIIFDVGGERPATK